MYGYAYSFDGITIPSMCSVPNFVIYLDVFPGTQACWELVSGFCFSCWLALLMLELWMQRMFHSISLLIPMTILYSQRKNVQLVKFQSEFIGFPCKHALLNFFSFIYNDGTSSLNLCFRPARSKHCSICGRCVARFDHHCGWMVRIILNHFSCISKTIKFFGF